MWADGLRRRGIDPRQDGARRPGTELAFPLVRFSIGTHGRDPSIGSWVRLLVGLARSGHHFRDRGPSQPQTHNDDRDEDREGSLGLKAAPLGTRPPVRR